MLKNQLPVTLRLEKNQLFDALPREKTLAVACSGGPDSMALTLLLAQWARKNKNPIIAITVDHGLRSESAQEAKKVAAWLKKRGITHVILRWEGKKPKSNLQEAARNARYDLLLNYCREHAIAHLLVAHTLEDQAETFLLRLARGSGVDGLSAMAAASQRGGITLHRPLLGVSKVELLVYLKTQKQDFIRDASNENPQYDRIKMRKAQPMLDSLGLTSERLASTAAAMARARECLEDFTAGFLQHHCRFYAEGYAELMPFEAPAEIALRVYASLVMAVGGHEVKPRLKDIERLQAAVNEKDFRGAALGGCLFVPKRGSLLVLREPGAVAAPMPAGRGVWDNYSVDASAKRGWTVGALTQQGWLEVSRAHGLKSDVPDKRILYSLPALRDTTGKVRAVAQLGVREKGVKFSAQFTGAQRCYGILPEDR